VTHPIDPLVDYALGSLEAAERVQLEAHLQGCAECRAEVARLRDALALLPEELEPVAVPQGSWERIEKQIRPAPRAFLPRWTLPAAATLFLLVTGFLGNAWLRGQATLREASDNAALVNRWLSWQDVRFVPLTNKSGQTLGRVLVLKDGRALVVMPEAAPAGQSYQAWGLFERSRTAPAASLGVSNRAVFEVRTEAYPWFWLSLEPSGGSKLPTKGVGWSRVNGG
jgi:Anti-sigma-K factor rskA/Putative zinc-finger